MESKKNVQIEAVRVISMLMVVIFHYTYRFKELYNIDTVNFDFFKLFGKIGVGIFFIISGYFLARDYSRKENPIRFFVNKLLRIYPLYAICITIIYVLTSIFGLPGRETSFIEYFLNLLLINGFIGINYVDGAHWFLTYMIIFYVMVAFTLIFHKNGKKVFLIFAGVNFILNIIKQYIPFGIYIYKLCGGDYFWFVFLGIFLRYFMKNISKFDLLAIILSLFMIFLNFKFITFLGILIGLILFILAVKQKMNFFNKQIFLTLGSVSYIIFLIHQNIGYQLLLFLCNVYGKYNILFIFVVFSIILAISFLLYKYCELPIERKINKILRRN